MFANLCVAKTRLVAANIVERKSSSGIVSALKGSLGKGNVGVLCSSMCEREWRSARKERVAGEDRARVL